MNTRIKITLGHCRRRCELLGVGCVFVTNIRGILTNGPCFSKFCSPIKTKGDKVAL
jgi:hypothetical protein